MGCCGSKEDRDDVNAGENIYTYKLLTVPGIVE